MADLPAHLDDVNTVAFNPTGTVMVSGGSDTALIFWDVAGRAEIGTVFGHFNAVRDVAFSPNGERIASASFDRTVRVWDAVTRSPVVVQDEVFAVGEAVAYTPEGDAVLAALGDGTVRLLNADTLAVTRSFTAPALAVTDAALSPDGAQLAVATGFPTDSVTLFDTATGDETATLTGHTATVSALAFLPDGTPVSAGEDGAVIVWDVDAAEPARTLTAPAPLQALAVSPSGAWLVAGGFDGTLYGWPLTATADAPALAQPVGDGALLALAFNPAGDVLAVGGEDGLLHLYTFAPANTP